MSYNVPVRTLQGGSTLEVATGGTVQIDGVLLLGGTAIKAAYGTATITAGGSVFVNTGLTTVVSAVGNPIRAAAAVNGAAGTYQVQIDNARFANGSITLLSVSGGTVTPGGGNVTWIAFGA